METQMNLFDGQDVQNCHLIHLPNIITENILDCLDSKSLRNLRLVCNQTKSWVEQPTYLQKLRIYLKDKDRMKEIMSSNVRWNNVSIPCSFSGCSNLPSFLRQFRPFLKRLKIMSNHPYDDKHPISVKHLVRILQYLGPQLESFKLSTGIDYIRNGDSEAIADWKYSMEESKENNLIGLRELHFRNMLNSPKQIVYDIVTSFLKISPNLVSIKLPVIDVSDDEDNSTSAEDTERQCEPLIAYLKENEITKRKSTLRLIYVHCCFSFYNRIDYPCIFPLSRSILLQLVKLCEPIGAKLYNVPSHILPTIPITDYEKSCLNQCIGSVFCKNNTQCIERLNLYDSKTKLGISVFLHDGDAHDDMFKLDETMNVSSIYVQCDEHLNIKDFDNIYYNLFQICRPSVTKLALQGKGFHTINGLKLSTIFPNLRKIFLSDITDRNYFDLEFFLDGLHYLEDLTLKNYELCTKDLKDCNLGQLGFIKSTSILYKLNKNYIVSDSFVAV